jgi:hypothetical protein
VVVKLATFPGLVTPAGTVQLYVYVPDGVGVAVIVAVPPAHIDGLLTDTVGGVIKLTVPEAGVPGQEGVPVVEAVTVYVPAIVVVKLATFPGLVTPAGTVQLYVYVPAGLGVAVIVAVPPVHIDGLFTVTVGGVMRLTVPEAGVPGHEGVPVVLTVTV